MSHVSRFISPESPCWLCVKEKILIYIFPFSCRTDHSAERALKDSSPDLACFRLLWMSHKSTLKNVNINNTECNSDLESLVSLCLVHGPSQAASLLLPHFRCTTLILLIFLYVAFRLLAIVLKGWFNVTIILNQFLWKDLPPHTAGTY